MIAGLDPYITDWLDLLGRWLHVIAAIVWIGTSFYFVALDNHLLPPKRRTDREEGVGGESWEIHGGGFYRIEKYQVAPRVLPEPLHWFKGEAYTTWLSGFALFVVLYYANASTYLIDPSVADLTPAAAVGISLALLVGTWLVYDLLCRAFAGHELLLAAAIAGCVTAAAYGVSQLFSARAMAIQLGAMLGTIMVANVLFVIIPAHWARPGGGGARAGPGGGVARQAALRAQQLPDPAGAARDAVAALPVHHRPVGRLARARRPDGDRRLDPPVLQPPARGPQRLADPRDRCAGDRRDRDRDPTRGRRRVDCAGPAGAVPGSAGDRPGSAASRATGEPDESVVLDGARGHRVRHARGDQLPGGADRAAGGRHHCDAARQRHRDDG